MVKHFSSSIMAIAKKPGGSQNVTPRIIQLLIKAEVINNEIGLLVEPGSVQDLTEKIMEALNKEWDNSYINEFSQQYTTKRNSVKVSQSYQNLLGI